MSKNKKSPITAKPLRYAGQSLDEEIEALAYDKILFYAIFCLVSVAAAINEWIRYYFQNPPNPKGITFLALIIVLFCSFKIVKFCKKVILLKQGRDGEKVVGQYLDLLRDDHSRIFHDLLGDNFNLDHVLISSKGIYVFETKTYSKPIKGQAVIEYNGKELKYNRRIPDDKPLIQVKAASSWLENLLLESTGKKFKIKPVVLFPGWFIETTPEGKDADVWVLNPKALPAFIKNQPDSISCSDVMLIAYHLSRFIRSN